MGNNPINPINFLRFTKIIKTKIDGHFILLSNKVNKFKICTSNPVKGIDCEKITNTNIKEEFKPQYITHNVHTVDPELHRITQTSECHKYFNENKNVILHQLNKLENDTE